MFKKLLFVAGAAGAIAWLSKNQETAKRYVDRYAGQAKGMAGSVPGVGREPAEQRLNDPALAAQGRERGVPRRADPEGQALA